MTDDEALAVIRGRLMDEHRIAEALYDIEQAPARQAAFRKHVLGEVVSALLLCIMLGAYLFHV